MTVKRKLQITADIVMTVMLPFLMAYQLIGETAHEWLGMAMLAAFICHHMLNSGWHKSLFYGRYNALRIINTATDIILFIDIIFLAVSGIMMSKHIFIFLNISAGMGFARTTHLLASYWGFVFMSIHLGFHWSMITTQIGRLFKRPFNLPVWAIRSAAALAAGYGVYAFIKREIGGYLLFQNQFVFFDFNEPFINFLMDHMAIMTAFAVVGHYFLKIIRTNQRNSKE